MPATVFHVKSATTPDSGVDEIVPSDWNSSHAFTFNAVGSEISGAFSNTPGGVTFGLETNGYITGGAPAGGGGITAINVSAGTLSQNLSALTFNNGGGVSFGLAASVITATVATNYLTTAMASNASSAFAGIGETVTTTAGTDLKLTVDTAGVNIAHPLWLTTAQPVGAYLTTARASNDGVGLNTAQSNVTWTVNSSGISVDARGYAGTGTTFNGANLSGSMTVNSNGVQLSLSAAAGGGGADGGNTIVAGTRTAGSNSAVLFDNANGITFGLNAVGGTILTASHNGLTTARASNDAIGLNTALTAGPLAWTVNSSGLSLNAGSAAGTTSGFGGNLISGSMTHNTAGLNLSLNHPAWLTTAAQSNHSHGNPQLNLTNLSGTTASNSAGFTLSLSAGNYLTTARASNDAVGLNTAQTNVTWTVNSSGISLNAGGYAGTGTSATNASITLNSNGLAISVAAPGGGGGTAATLYANSNTTQSSSGTVALSSMIFAGAGIASVGVTNGSVVVSVPSGGGAGDGGVFAGVSNLGNTAGSTGTVSTGNFVLVGGSNISLSQSTGGAGSAATVTINAPNSSSLVGVAPISISTAGSTVSVIQAPISVYEPFEFKNNTAWSSHGQNTLYLQRLWPDNNYAFSAIEKMASINVTSSTNSQSVAHTIRYGLYSRDVGASSTRMTLEGSSAIIFRASFNSNTTAGYTISLSGGTSYTSNSAGTGNLTQLTAAKLFYLPYVGTLKAGVEYALGFHVSTASAVNTAALRLSFMELTNFNNTTFGRIAHTTVNVNSATIYEEFDQVMHRTTQTGLIASYQNSECQVQVSRARQYIIFGT